MTDHREPSLSSTDDTTEPETPLWAFALRLYAVPNVAETCLTLQDRHAADVNLLLLCCWVGCHGAYLPRDQIATLDQLVTAWRTEVIAPVRALRRLMKLAVGPVQPDQSAGVRKAIKSAELQAEKVELEFLYKALESLPAKNAHEADRGGVIRSNLLHYLTLLGIDSGTGEVRAAIEMLVSETVALSRV